MQTKSCLNKMVAMSHLNTMSARPFSVAYNVRSKFEAAYKEKMAALAKVPKAM